ncbi:DoxX family protein [Flavobacteriaceae bacterium TK19130]|nr:DoxX family protein [Thermobacterium salinum]
MSFSEKLDRIHWNARRNKWLQYFAIFNRFALALGFLPSGMQKVLGFRFTALPVNHPMGHYLDALFQTGYYYTTIGIFQVLAAILLNIPRTATLGAIIYFPIILNITILSLAVRFDGSLFSSPLMVLSCLFLLCWDYHKVKWILPFQHKKAKELLPKKEEFTFRFPWKFFLGVLLTIVAIVAFVVTVYDLYPRNTMSHCKQQCPDDENPELCLQFCDCIHTRAQSLESCLEAYETASK